jgi:hypothetical protein
MSIAPALVVAATALKTLLVELHSCHEGGTTGLPAALQVRSHRARPQVGVARVFRRVMCWARARARASVATFDEIPHVHARAAAAHVRGEQIQIQIQI